MPLPAANLLAQEKSPYLLQHKDNPVHWRAWSREALAEAKAAGRPILLSVGYAACHWCHIMAHENFEDEAVAAVMNRLFVNIKVDREERPDIDQIYMAALAATGEQGGWPLTMFLTPDAEAFWGGTYFPKEPRYGRPGFVQVLHAVDAAWRERPAEIAAGARRLTAHIGAQLAGSGDAGELSPTLGVDLARKIGEMVDTERGGLKGAPKFPSMPFMTTLWLDWLQNRTVGHRDAVLLTLRHMLAGGVYDHVGGGLCRYSTDADWTVPHFEKMLYDNAQLIQLLGWVASECPSETFRSRTEGTIGWLLREMTVAEGGFASSLDADSGGEEGAFYTWTRAELAAVLGPETETLLTRYVLASPPAWEGNPILRLRDTDDHDATVCAPLLSRLREAREKRVRPGRDDKVLVDWNGLAIRAIAEAARQHSRPDWLEAARRAFRFVAESASGEGLPHSINAGADRAPGLASDYAAMVNAAVSLHEATNDAFYVNSAARWLDALHARYRDGSNSGYFLTASDSADVPLRLRGDFDEATPSSTGQIIEALTRFAMLTGDWRLLDKARDTAAAAVGRAQNLSYGQAGIINAAALVLDPWKLAIVGAEVGSGIAGVAAEVRDPRRVDLAVAPNADPTAAGLPAGAVPDTSRPGAWLCRGLACLPPIAEPDELRRRLLS